MRATILPKDIILTKAHRAAVWKMTKGCTQALWPEYSTVLPRRCFSFVLPNYINIYATIIQYCSCTVY